MTGPSVSTIPPHRSFADALAAGLLARFGGDPTGLARGLVLLPNNRAVRALTDAFVRRAERGLLLPRLVPVGDPDLDERIGGMFDPLDGDVPIPPAIDPYRRLMLLAGLIQQHQGSGAGEAFRLASDLARTLDQLIVEEIDPARLRDFAAEVPDLSIHWQASLDRLRVILDEWPLVLAREGAIDLPERRNRLLRAVTRRWRAQPPGHFVVAAGITTAAPAVAALLGMVARLPNGEVVLPGLDTGMDQDVWDRIGPTKGEEQAPRPGQSAETHPQFQLKLLLDRMSVGRHEVGRWRWSGGSGATAARSRAISNAMLPATDTGRWKALRPADRRLSGVRAAEVADPFEESQLIALALRQALETPGKTAALVTPDRTLARRVSAHLRRWDIVADDSAGRPLAATPPGTFLLALVEAATSRFAPVSLLALLKHPLTWAGDERPAWLASVRGLDLALRGPRPAAGLDGITVLLGEAGSGGSDRRRRLVQWWEEVVALLRPLEEVFAGSEAAPSFTRLLAAVRESASGLAGDAVWSGIAGRAAADLFSAVEAACDAAPDRMEGSDLAPILEQLMRDVAVRPPYGQHPRLFIWGLIEARLQHADLMILGGLNEGVWPGLPAPDPWLAPRLRSNLALPGLERRIGLAAHDFAVSLGAREVLITRARRDARSPTVASRFWLRLEAMTGGIARAPQLRQWAQAIDRPDLYAPAARPAPAPPAAIRPRDISVTDVDRLKADPFAFYARKILKLPSLDDVDADLSAAWRGSAVHAVLEAWMKEDDCNPSTLRSRAEAFLRGETVHPLIRALWLPRLLEAIDFIGDEVDRNRGEGRLPLAAEVKGRADVGGITLNGVADRIDRAPDGSLIILDYKTGMPPSQRAVFEGFSMQLGLIGMIAEKGGFAPITGTASGFEYWSLARKAGRLGHVVNAVGGKNGIDPADFTTIAERNFSAATQRWLIGDEPFTAKLHPAYAPYGEYDQLMRLEEWYGRED